MELHKSFLAVKIISVYYCERLIYNVLATADCMTVTPWLNTSLRYGIALRKTVKLLVNVIYLDVF